MGPKEPRIQRGIGFSRLRLNNLTDDKFEALHIFFIKFRFNNCDNIQSTNFFPGKLGAIR